MSPLETPVQELDDKFVNLIGKFVSDVKNGKLRGSTNVALEMVNLLETIITESEHTTVNGLCGAVRSAGRLVCGALPHAPAAANMARRVLRAIRDEHRAAHHQSGGEAGGEAGGESLARLVLAGGARRASAGAAPRELRCELRGQLGELRCELRQAAAGVGGAAARHVRGGELLLTSGASALAERFLRAAAPRRYRLLLAEGPAARLHQTHLMASRLSAAGVPVTLISNAAIFAVMSRVNKVVLSVAAALGGGAVLLAPGASAVTAAAKHYSVPVLALAPLHKLCPLHAADAAHLSALTTPAHTIDYERHECGEVHVMSPQYDFAPPDHITLFITNLGGSSPSYMYRMLSELYDPSDYVL